MDLLRLILRPTRALLLSPLGLILISATRLLVVSNDRPSTAIGIASSGGYVSTLLGTLIPMVPIFMPYIALFFLIFRRFLVSAIAFIAAAFISPAQVHLAKPITSYTRADLWHATLTWISLHKTWVIVLVFVLFLILMAWFRDTWGQHAFYSSLWVTGSAAFLLPLVAPIYSVPRTFSFCVGELRQPWLPAEKFTLASGVVDCGYTLHADEDWFEILTLGSRTIRFIPTTEVAARAVCVAPSEQSYSPLIPLPPTAPSPASPCPEIDGPAPPAEGEPAPRTPAASYLSHGESLNVISASTHISPQDILSETNAYQHQQLSGALRAYEQAMNWDAPTPYGQRFWYYPQVPQSR